MKRTVILDNIPSQWFMSWEMATQANNKIVVVLKDSQTSYVNNSTQGPPATRKILSEGYQQVQGQSLQLEIDVENAKSLPLRVLPFLVANDSGVTVVRGYNIFIEDWNDGDYNDLTVTLIACKKPG